jgi:uncharacterized membrane protein YvlD (DUF360 family)
MVRFLVNVAVYLSAAAIGLLGADILLDGVSVSYPVGFLFASVLFGTIQALLTPIFARITSSRAEALTGAVGVISALAALVSTSLLSQGLAVRGLVTWLLAAVVIWIASIAASLILARTVAKKLAAQKSAS